MYIVMKEEWVNESVSAGCPPFTELRGVDRHKRKKWLRERTAAEAEDSTFDHNGRREDRMDIVMKDECVNERVTADGPPFTQTANEHVTRRGKLLLDQAAEEAESSMFAHHGRGEDGTGVVL